MIDNSALKIFEQALDDKLKNLIEFYPALSIIQQNLITALLNSAVKYDIEGHKNFIRILDLTETATKNALDADNDSIKNQISEIITAIKEYIDLLISNKGLKNNLYYQNTQPINVKHFKQKFKNVLIQTEEKEKIILNSFKTEFEKVFGYTDDKNNFITGQYQERLLYKLGLFTIHPARNESIDKLRSSLNEAFQELEKNKNIQKKFKSLNESNNYKKPAEIVENFKNLMKEEAESAQDQHEENSFIPFKTICGFNAYIKQILNNAEQLNIIKYSNNSKISLSK